MNPVVHFEMPAEDRTRMRAFYERTFGWKTEQLGPEVGDYVLVHVGFAIAVVDEEEARFVFEYLEQTGEATELVP